MAKKNQPCDPCCTGGGGSAPMPIGCTCATIPTPVTLNLLTSPIDDWPTTSTMSYRNIAVFNGLLGSGSRMWSDTLYTGVGTNDFYILLNCSTSTFTIRRAFPESEFGGPYIDTAIYEWSMIDTGNDCSPFALTNGNVYSGGPSIDYSVT